jgi:hypothetical protein
MPRITKQTAGDCAGRDCPKTWDTTDPEMIGIRIKRPGPADDLTAAGETPAGEFTGFVPRALLRAWASAQS